MVNAPCFAIVPHVFIRKGKVDQQERLVFKDPQEKMLQYQIERWKKSEEIAVIHSKDIKEESKIEGIRLLTKLEHVCFTILRIITLGFVVKSFDIVLGNRKIYVDLGSYEKFRKYNGLDLNNLGIMQKAGFFNICQVRRKELLALEQLLKAKLDKRPHFESSITTAKDMNEMFKCAMNWASMRIRLIPKGKMLSSQKSVLDKIHHQLAAFYIIMHSKIDPGCIDGAYLSISKAGLKEVAAYPHAISLEEIEKINAKKPAERTKIEEEKLKKIRIVHELGTNRHTQQGHTAQILVTHPDPLSSPLTPNDPVRAKELLQQLVKAQDNFYTQFAQHLLSPILKQHVPIRNSAESREFRSHIESMGKALQELYGNYNAATEKAIASTLKSSFLKLANLKIFNEDNLYMIHDISSVHAAWLLFSNAEFDRKKIKFSPDEDNEFTLRISSSQSFLDLTTSTNTPFSLCDGSPLTGFFNGEAGSIFTALTHSDLTNLLKQIKQLSPTQKLAIENKFILDAEATANDSPLTDNRLKEELSKKMKTTINDKDFAVVKKVYNQLERVGLLIRDRFLGKYKEELEANIEFNSDGQIATVKNSQTSVPLVRRSDEEHAQIIATYFPGKNIPLPERQIAPCFDPAVDNMRNLSGKKCIDALFHNPRSHGSAGNCCTGALAQAVFGQYDSITGQLLGEDVSRNSPLIRQIRQAIGNYMKSNPEDFLDVIDCSSSDMSIKREYVLRRANLIMQSTEWLTSVEIKAFSHIVGRPIHIIRSENIRINKSTNMIRTTAEFNNHFDAEPIYLYLENESHYDHLRPRRIGSIPKSGSNDNQPIIAPSPILAPMVNYAHEHNQHDLRRPFTQALHRGPFERRTAFITNAEQVLERSTNS